MFNEKYNNQLSMFDLQHLLTLLVMLVIVVLIFMFKNRFTGNRRNDKIFRYSLASFLLVFEVVFHIWTLVNKQYTIDMLPLIGFCAMCNVLTIYYLFTDNRKVANLTIYYACDGAFFSLVFVDISYGIPHFRYFHYFYVHFGFLLAGLYYYATNKLTLSSKNINRASLYLILYTLVLLVLDFVFDKNWFYLKQSPVVEISDFFGKLYTPLWIVTIALLLRGWYYLLKVFERKK